MICSSCSSTYSPRSDQLGQVESLSGLCEYCGTEPGRVRFARSFAAGAFSGVLIIEILLLLLLLGGMYTALVPILVVAVISLAVYAFALRSDPVRYDDEQQRKEQSQSQRIAGGVLGFAVGIGVVFSYFYWMLQD